MRKELADWHIQQLIDEQEANGGELILSVVYSDQEEEEFNGLGYMKASSKLMATTALTLSEHVETDDLIEAAKEVLKEKTKGGNHV